LFFSLVVVLLLFAPSVSAFQLSHLIHRLKASLGLKPEPCYPNCDKIQLSNGNLVTDDDKLTTEATVKQRHVVADYLTTEAHEAHKVAEPMRFAPTTVPPLADSGKDEEAAVATIADPIVSLPKPPSMFTALGVVGGGDKTSDYGKLKLLDQKINRITKSIGTFDDWLTVARKQRDATKRLIDETVVSRKQVNIAIERLRMMKDHVLKHIKKDQLIGRLREAQGNLEELDAEYLQLEAADRLMQKTRENVQDYITRSATSMGIPKDQIEAKLQEIVDLDSPLAVVVKQYDDYGTA